MRVPFDADIRSMKHEDVEEVVRLEMEAFDSPWSREIFEYELDRCEEATYLVADTGEGLCGYIGMHFHGAEVHITNMAVRPGLRGSGLGSALLLECIELSAARGARWLTLEVRIGNTAARSFYRGFGFEELGLRRGYYRDTGEDALIMATGDIREESYRELVAARKASLEAGEAG